MLKLLKFLFTLEGRISRKQFWLNYILVMFGLNFVVSFLVVMLTVGFSQLSTLGDVIGVVMFAGLGLIWLLMTPCVQSLHVAPASAQASSSSRLA